MSMDQYWNRGMPPKWSAEVKDGKVQFRIPIGDHLEARQKLFSPEGFVIRPDHEDPGNYSIYEFPISVLCPMARRTL